MLWAFRSLAAAVAVSSAAACAVPFEAWESSAFDAPWRFPWLPRVREAEWEFKDPSFLYITIQEKRRHEGGIMTFLHPIMRRSAAYEESFMPGHEQDARAFG